MSTPIKVESIETWIAVAQRFGDGLERDDLTGGELRFRAEIKGAPITVVSERGRAGRLRTMVRATARGAGSLRVKATKEGMLASIGKRLGMQDVQLGDADFDATYLVKANDEALARLWLSDEARAFSLAASDREGDEVYDISIEAGGVSLSRSGLEDDEDRLESAIRAVDALARRSEEIAVELQKLSAWLGGRVTSGGSIWRPDGSFSISVDYEDSPIAIDWTTTLPGSKSPALYTRLRCPRRSVTWDHFLVAESGLFDSVRKALPRQLEETYPGGFERLQQDYGFACDDRPFFNERLDLDVRSRLEKTMPALIFADDKEICGWIEGFEVDTDRLAGMLALLQMLREKIDDGLSQLRGRRITKTATYELSEPWKFVARSLKGELVRGDGGRPSILVIQDGLLLRATTEQTNRGTIQRTVIQTNAPGAGHLWLIISGGEVQREPWMPTTGDSAFDDRFCIKANDEQAALSWLGARARRTILEVQEGDYRPEYDIVLKAGVVTLTSLDWEADRGRLITAIRVALELGGRGAALKDAWRSLAGALGGSLQRKSDPIWTPEGGAAIVTEAVTIDLIAAGLHPLKPSLMTRARAERNALGGQLVICRERRCYQAVEYFNVQALRRVSALPDELSGTYKLFSDAPMLVELVQQEKTLDLLRSVAPVALHVEPKAVTLLCEGMVRNERRLRNAAQLISALRADTGGEGSVGPYR